MKEYATFNTNHLPLILVRFTGEKANDQNFSLYLDSLKKCYDKKEKIAIVFDANKTSLPGFKFQKMQGQWLKENKLLMEEYCVGTAYIISNMLVRNVLKAIFKIQEQPVPYFICKTQKEAEEWVNSIKDFKSTAF